jgi:hypothetical protein
MAGASRTQARGQLAGAPIRSAPAAKVDANKTKEIQGNPSKKACISLDSFGGIETFQWVTANPNKKIFLFVFFTKLRRNIRFSFAARTPWRPGSPGSKKTIAQIPIFEKTMCARSGATIYVSGLAIPPVALVARSRRRHSDPSRLGQDRTRRILWLGSSSAGHKVAAVKLREFFARCALASIQLN